MASPIPLDLAEYLKALAPFGRPIIELTPEELLPKGHIFDQAPDPEDFGQVEHPKYQSVAVETSDLVPFRAFLDGVQRTVQFREVPLANGAVVPVHIAQVAVGIFLRDELGRLFSQPGSIVSRLLLLMPFDGIIDAGVPLPQPTFTSDTSHELFDLSGAPTVFCDTTFPGIETSRDVKSESALMGPRLYDSGDIRSRAQGRVAVMRQILELLLLARFRRESADDWILVDGPLFFLHKWQSKWQAANDMTEEVLLRRAVGLIKSLRKRPKDPGVVLNLSLDERSSVTFLEWEVDIKGSGRTPDEMGKYTKPHLCWFTRLRPPRGGLAPPTHTGLVRLDVHFETLGLRSGDSPELTPSGFGKHRDLVDQITAGVHRERWPAVGSGRYLRSFGQIYPVDQLERVLHSGLLSKRALAYLADASM